MFHKKILYLFLIAFVGVSIGYFISKVTKFFPTSKNISLYGAIVQSSLLPIINLPVPSATPSSVKILFGGDLMFDRNIRVKMQTSGVDFILEPLSDLFHQYDVVVANLEGPVTTAPSRSVNSAVGSTNNFIFTFDPSIIPMLYKNNLQIVNIGNNHIGNFGKSGIEETKLLLSQGKVHFFGNTGHEENSQQRIHFQKFGMQNFAFVNMNQFVSNGFESGVTDVIFARQKADIVIVMTHWGNEYTPIANQVIVDQAHTMIDAGADLIIGMHPHVIQQTEVYKEKKIYYSLGNFVFDQYFSAETQKGLLVGVEFLPDGKMNFTNIPIKLQKNGQTTR